MSEIFFKELRIPEPDYNLEVGSGLHGKQTGEILARLEQVLLKEQPDRVLVYGDTNSTLAGALAAAKLHIPAAHVEAGLRSFDRTMPEEINRVVADHLSDLLLCPTPHAVHNLASEGIRAGVHLVGDVMVDALYFNRDLSIQQSRILDRLSLSDRKYLVITIHRPANTDDRKNMESIIGALEEADKPVVFPLHPRTRKYLKDYGLLNQLPSNIRITEPLGYLDMLRLMSRAEKILTDSGGVQKEAYLLKVPCITLRQNTEWVETIEDGWNILVGADREKIIRAIDRFSPYQEQHEVFGTGGASARIREILGHVW